MCFATVSNLKLNNSSLKNAEIMATYLQILLQCQQTLVEDRLRIPAFGTITDMHQTTCSYVPLIVQVCTVATIRQIVENIFL